MRRVLALAGVMWTAAATAAGLPQDSYVWQRAWSPAVTQAIREQADLIRSWRVLAAQSDRGGPLRVFTPDAESLRNAGRPVVAVVRIDGARARWRESDLSAAIATLAAQWPLPLSGIEIDHDSATARLGDYAALLAALRQRLPPDLRLSVTALPAWLDSPDLDKLLAQVDEVVLQVHGVFPAPHPLFEPDRAMGWAQRLSERSTKPFRLALPAYGITARRDNNGSVVAVEAEAPTGAGGTDAVRLRADPAQVARLLRELEKNPPRGLAGIVWFRLPTAQDRQAWSPATLRAVITGAPLDASIRPQVAAGDRPGLMRLFLSNDGAVETRLPRRITLPQGCAVADGIGGWRLNGHTLTHPAPPVLAEGKRTEIGWARCALTTEDLHVEAD